MAGTGSGNISISPVNVLWRIEASEQVSYAGLVAASMGNSYYTIYSAKDATEYHVWHNLDAGGVDPAPAGSTAIEVAISTGDSATVMAAAAAAAIDALGDFSASSSGEVLTANRTAFGEVTPTADFDAGVSVTICRSGKDFDLGLIEGDVELSVAPSNFIVQAHQTGVTPRAALFQGLESLEVTTSLFETPPEQLAKIYNLYGETFTPAAGTEVTGIGTSKQGQNLLTDAARLVLKPTNAVDDSENVTLMLAVPVPDSLKFSGETPKTLSITWQGYVDDQIDSRGSAFLLGDETQAGLRN